MWQPDALPPYLRVTLTENTDPTFGFPVGYTFKTFGTHVDRDNHFYFWVLGPGSEIVRLYWATEIVGPNIEDYAYLFVLDVISGIDPKIYQGTFRHFLQNHEGRLERPWRESWRLRWFNVFFPERYVEWKFDPRNNKEPGRGPIRRSADTAQGLSTAAELSETRIDLTSDQVMKSLETGRPVG